MSEIDGNAINVKIRTYYRVRPYQLNDTSIYARMKSNNCISHVLSSTVLYRITYKRNEYIIENEIHLLDIYSENLFHFHHNHLSFTFIVENVV